MYVVLFFSEEQTFFSIIKNVHAVFAGQRVVAESETGTNESTATRKKRKKKILNATTLTTKTKGAEPQNPRKRKESPRNHINQR